MTQKEVSAGIPQSLKQAFKSTYPKFNGVNGSFDPDYPFDAKLDPVRTGIKTLIAYYEYISQVKHLPGFTYKLVPHTQDYQYSDPHIEVHIAHSNGESVFIIPEKGDYTDKIIELLIL